MSDFNLAVVRGLLQTEDYARALITDDGFVAEEAIEPRVQARRKQQALLHRIQPPWCRFIVHESAPRLPVGGNIVMNDQLLHLVFASSRPHTDIRVVPFEAGPHSGIGGDFRIMEYEKAKPVVYLEQDVASVYLDGSNDVGHYRKVVSK